MPCPTPNAAASKNEADSKPDDPTARLPTLTTLSLLSLTAAVSVALLTLAATPDVHRRQGDHCQSVGDASSAEPTTVSPGSRVQFRIWARNDDTPSTVSQALTENTPRTVYSATWTSSNGTSGTCATTTPLSCSFGQLKPQQSINAVIVLQTPTTGTSMLANFAWSNGGHWARRQLPIADTVGAQWNRRLLRPLPDRRGLAGC